MPQAFMSLMEHEISVEAIFAVMAIGSAIAAVGENTITATWAMIATVAKRRPSSEFSTDPRKGLLHEYMTVSSDTASVADPDLL
ncbi:hypothetical protein D4765_15860 [Subtercola vilae]|uniref:Uncharacterized protein n=1 Tax=Subtercola vilae TaxID=2056433 RepID=A0A4T2BL64_9MICO|nr:hypothetical protein D4765_15860 [Subtercola vilae]